MSFEIWKMAREYFITLEKKRNDYSKDIVFLFLPYALETLDPWESILSFDKICSSIRLFLSLSLLLSSSMSPSPFLSISFSLLLTLSGRGKFRKGLNYKPALILRSVVPLRESYWKWTKAMWLFPFPSHSNVHILEKDGSGKKSFLVATTENGNLRSHVKGSRLECKESGVLPLNNEDERNALTGAILVVIVDISLPQVPVRTIPRRCRSYAPRKDTVNINNNNRSLKHA